MPWSSVLKRPGTIGFLAVLLMLLMGLPGGIYYWVGRERVRLVRQLRQERLLALTKVAEDVEEDMEDVTDELRFVSRLLASGVTRSELRLPLLALLGTARAYRGLALFDEFGGQVLLVSDPRRPFTVSPQVFAAMKQTVVLAVKAPPNAVRVSRPVEVNRNWYRIFAVRRVPRGEALPVAVVALIVEMRHYLAKLRLAAADPRTELLVLGPHGQPASVSSPRIVRALGLARRSAPDAVLSKVILRMRRSERGTARVAGAEAEPLGLGSADLVVAYLPIRVDSDQSWSVATISSMASIRKHELALMLRLGLGALAITLLIFALGVFVLRTSHFQATLTERLRNAEEIAHLHEKAARILSNIPTSVLVIGEDLRITDGNDAMRSQLPDLSSGASLKGAFPTARRETIARIAELLTRADKSGETACIVGDRLYLFGDPGHYRISAVPIDPPRPEARLLLVIDDISELKALEDQLLRTEKLATIGTLSAGIAHEIGTPLSVVRGRTEYALSKLGPEHPEARGLQTVIEQTDRVIRTVRELLDYSRTKPAEITRVDLEEVMRKSVELLRYEAGRRNLHIELNLEDGLPPVAANADQLQQVLINLLMNAFDASTDRGKIQVRVYREGAPAEHAGAGCVHIEVVDQGHGIDPEAKHRIIDPFFTTKKRGQGTGLGLFIVAQIVRSHGAEISFVSEPGQGTQVCLTWPVFRENADVEAA